jgi:hypothetical protein
MIMLTIEQLTIREALRKIDEAPSTAQFVLVAKLDLHGAKSGVFAVNVPRIAAKASLMASLPATSNLDTVRVTVQYVTLSGHVEYIIG